MSNLKNNDFIVLNKLIILSSNLLTHEELLILLFLHTGSKSISTIKSKFSMSQTKFQKSISFLENNGFIESVNEVLSLGESAEFSSLSKREGVPIGNLGLGETQETSSLLLSVTGYESFATSISMPAKHRELSYMLFERLGWDTSRPFDRIINISNWGKECRQLLMLSNNDLRIVREAIDILKEKNYSITSPRSLLKTVASIKNGVSFNFKKIENDDSAPEVF